MEGANRDLLESGIITTQPRPNQIPSPFIGPLCNNNDPQPNSPDAENQNNTQPAILSDPKVEGDIHITIPPDKSVEVLTLVEKRNPGGGATSPKKYYESEEDQFLRPLESPPLDEQENALFQPESLGPDLCITFRRMLNYKFPNKTGNNFSTLESMNMFCVRALPDIPVAIEFAPEVDLNARMRPRAFALCGRDLLPKYYALEYTPPSLAFLNCMPCMTCFRQPFNLAIYGLDGSPVLRITSETLENFFPFRFMKECCCHKGVAKRMSIKAYDDAVIGSLVEYQHCFMTQWLQIHVGACPKNKEELIESAVVEWQSKCRCMDSTMLYCGCKTDVDAEGSAMIMADKDGRKYATARPWTGMTTEDLPFLFVVRFTANCPIEMKALAMAGSFIYNNLNWETSSDHTICHWLACIFCTLRCWSLGPVTMDYDNWSNEPAHTPSAYLPWVTVNRPGLHNYKKV